MIAEQEWLEGLAPAKQWENEVVKHSLDELYRHARKYRSSKAYGELLSFVKRFRFYAPYNAMLLHIQCPGAVFVAPAHRWGRDYGRRVITTARPLLILQPMGPIMFVFDVSDTEPGENAKPLPPQVERPFEPQKGVVGSEMERTKENAKRDGVRISTRKEGSQSAGSICAVNGKGIDPLLFSAGKDQNGEEVTKKIPVRYDLVINEQLSRTAQYATMVHELAHLYCGHIGSPNQKWWPDRRGMKREIREFEAESVTYLICERLGIDNLSDTYLSGYLNANQEIPDISIECVMKASGLLEQMGRERLKPRKEKG